MHLWLIRRGSPKTASARDATSAAGNPTQANGRMFWFMRKKFFESYLVLSSWRRR